MSYSKEVIMQEFARRASMRKFYGVTPYDWQQMFMDAGTHNAERALVAGNRTGKTFVAGYEVACHLIGEYPEGWNGWMPNKPIHAWVSSLTNETSRDIVQKILLGEPNMIGTGLIIGDKIDKVSYRQAGISGVVDTVTIKGKYGQSVLQFKTAEQGWQKFQGTEQDLIWQDEEPADFRIFTECLARIMTAKGRYMLTYTPLLGETPLYMHFAEGGDGIYIQNATWDMAPPLTEDDKKRILASFPKHERDTRSKGMPMMGQRAVFPISDEDIMCDPFKIPDHYARIAGADFGINHPAAGAWIAHDMDTDTIYVYDCYKKDNQLAPYHASAFRHRGGWIPVAWPHDGMNTEKASGNKIAEAYIEEGANMMHMSARYDDEKGGSQAVEPIVMEVYQRMEDGRLKVFSNQHQWFSEKRSMMRDKNNKIRATNDDIMKATFYAIMMLRYARPQYVPTPVRMTRPIFSTAAR